jgi:glycosyltransferase involved in cell wall biosynthesis
MIRFIKEENLDYQLFHGHYVDAGIVTLAVAGHYSRPAYFTAHSLGAWKREQMGGDPDEMESKFNFNHRVAEENRILNTVEGNSVTTELQLDKLRELYDYPKDNVEVIAPGVDIHRFHPVDDTEKQSIEGLPEKYIYCLSRIDTNKGHDMLLEAFHVLLNNVPDAHLVIGGGSPNPKPREKKVFDMMHSIIDKYDLGAKVHFIGYVPDEMMVSYYQNASAFVLPSLFEPFGMTAQESMACGVPVIASKYGGIRTVIQSGHNGILVDPKDANEFAASMEKLINDKETRRRIGNAGLELIRKYFSWEFIARKHLDFYSHFSDLIF